MTCPPAPQRWIPLCALAIVALGACTRSAEAPVAEPEPTPGATASTATASSSPRPTTAVPGPGGPHSLPTYGVVETTERPLGAGETTCEPDPPPADPVEARSSAPGSPTVIVAVPDGFTRGAAPQGDVALNLTGPDGMTATVTITPTTLDAAGALNGYADERTAGSHMSSLSILPGDLCGYSGQKLMGTLADQPGRAIEYADRVVHVWTGDGDFLVAIRVQAPDGTPSFDAAESVLLGDFGIRMP